jgi:hypothetical protein
LNAWKDAVKPEIEGALIDGVAITAHYLIAWMQAAQRTVPDKDPRFFIQAFAGTKGSYWAVDKDGHLFRRLGWSYGWRLVTTPKDIRVVSIGPDREGGVYAVTADGVQYLDADEKWERVYPPPLLDERLLPEIHQLAVVDRTSLWALDPNGYVYQGEGGLPVATWADTHSPPVTGISANSADSVWGVNARNHGVWEYSAGNWQLRGEGVIHVSVDLDGKPWGISEDGRVVRYDGASWRTPPEFSDAAGGDQTPGFGALASIDARGTFVVVDREGVAWAPSGVTIQGENPWMPLG